MLNEYLEFARYQKNEETETANLNDVIVKIVEKYQDEKININLEENLTINMRSKFI